MFYEKDYAGFQCSYNEPFILFNNSTVHVPLKTRVSFINYDKSINYKSGSYKTYFDTQQEFTLYIQPRTELIIYADQKYVIINDSYNITSRCIKNIGIINSIKVTDIKECYKDIQITGQRVDDIDIHHGGKSVLTKSDIKNKFYYGAHVNIYDNDDGIIGNIKKIINVGGNCIQIFLTKPLHKGITKRSDSELSEIRDFIEKKNIKLVIHSSYMINLANIPNINDKNISWWIKNFIDELIYSSKLGALGCVIHFGKHLDMNKEMAIQNMINSLVYVLDNTPDNSKIIIETSSGQGTEICYLIEDFAKFYKKIPKKYKKRIGVCIDTCHIFAAGYDIREGYRVLKFLKKFDKLIGLDNIVLVHLNDSKKNLGEKKDRHEALGKGYIGIEGLEYFIKYCYRTNIPIILETPGEYYKQEIKYIRRFIKNI